MVLEFFVVVVLVECTKVYDVVYFTCNGLEKRVPLETQQACPPPPGGHFICCLEVPHTSTVLCLLWLYALLHVYNLHTLPVRSVALSGHP